MNTVDQSGWTELGLSTANIIISICKFYHYWVLVLDIVFSHRLVTRIDELQDLLRALHSPLCVSTCVPPWITSRLGSQEGEVYRVPVTVRMRATVTRTSRDVLPFGCTPQSLESCTAICRITSVPNEVPSSSLKLNRPIPSIKA